MKRKKSTHKHTRDLSDEYVYNTWINSSWNDVKKNWSAMIEAYTLNGYSVSTNIYSIVYLCLCISFFLFPFFSSINPWALSLIYTFVLSCSSAHWDNAVQRSSILYYVYAYKHIKVVLSANSGKWMNVLFNLPAISPPVSLFLSLSLCVLLLLQIV